MQFARSQHTSKEISKTYNLKNNLWKVIHNNFLSKSNKNQSMVCKSSSKCHFLVSERLEKGRDYYSASHDAV